MKPESNRRRFLGIVAGGWAAGVLGLLPGTVFARAAAAAGRPKQARKPTRPRTGRTDTIENVFARTRESDVYETVRSARLPGEDKLAITAVRELEEEELRGCLSAIRQGGSVAGEGRMCGTNCGNDCGTICGVSCSDLSRGALGVIDREGELGLKLSGLDAKRFVASSDKLLELR